MRPLVFLVTGLLSLLGFVVAFAVGLFSGKFLNWQDWDEICAGRPLDPRYPSGTSQVLPLSHECRWSDGTATQLVPDWVNPALFTLLAVAAVCLVLSAWTALAGRRRRGARLAA